MPVAPRVLLVEDDVDTREGYETYLRWCGLGVDSAGNGLEALERLNTTPADLVVMDMGLPGLSGWETIRRIRDRPFTADLPLVALTGHVAPADEAAALEMGCAAFLTKPCAPPHLVATIERALVRRWSHELRERARTGRGRHHQLLAHSFRLLAEVERNHAALAANRAALAANLSELKALSGTRSRLRGR
jgi:CheY-like chemotaxis protein